MSCPSDFYQRNLPHWHPPGASFFLTWRLYGSLPVNSRKATNGCAANTKSQGRRFVELNHALDVQTSGPHWLKEPRVANCILEALRRGERQLNYFILRSFVIMPNHIHLLITSNIPLAKITDGLKGASARTANSILNRTGSHFWQDESFDHWIRSMREAKLVRSYIERNPVSAGLVKRPQVWPWSSASIPLTAQSLF